MRRHRHSGFPSHPCRDGLSSDLLARYPKLLRKFDSRRPTWAVHENSFLSPSLQNLFTMSYFREDGSIIPSGWSGIQDNQQYPKLETRIPTSAAPDTWSDGGDGPASDDDSGGEVSPAPV